MMRRGNRDDVVVALARLRDKPVPIARVEERLKQWAHEYRDGWGSSGTVLSRLIDHKGFVPDARGFTPVPTNTPADEIERIVVAMQVGGMRREATVLRSEYFDTHSPDSVRFEDLHVGRAGYYTALAVAKAYVAGKLGY